MTGRLLWLPAALRDAGLRVSIVGGWESRGRATMHPKGLVLHHTAAPTTSNAPSLRVVIDGRSDLPGPLCHVLVGRDLTCHVIASGVSYHAGTGGWRGISGNASVIGVECENNGTTEPWSAGMVDVMVRISAVCANAAGFGAEMVCFHKEWAPQRKVDPHSLNATEIRRRVADLLRPPITAPQEEPDMDPAALVVVTYNAVLGRNPENLWVIGQWVDHIKAHGQLSFVSAVANSTEAKNRQAAAK